MDAIEQMRSFVAVAEAGSFTAAGRKLGKSKALISKHIGDLEDRLGARLLNRTTRQVHVTEIGGAYLQRARDIVADFDALEDSVRANTGVPRGRLRLTAPQAFGELELMELVCGFKETYPLVEVDIFLSDRVVDLVGEGYDIALRVTAMADSSLIARKLCDMPIRLCASPGYLARAGVPKAPKDLIGHACIVDTNMSMREAWRFRTGPGGEMETVRVEPTVQVNSAVAVRKAVLCGRGISLCPDFAVAREIADGRLVELMPGTLELGYALHLVYPHRLHLSAKARAFIDFTVAWYARGAPWQAIPAGSGNQAAAVDTGS